MYKGLSEKRQREMKSFEDVKADGDNKINRPRKLEWANEVISRTIERPRADRPSPLLEEYMRENPKIQNIRAVLNEEREAHRICAEPAEFDQGSLIVINSNGGDRKKLSSLKT
ncbi:MAG: hypothetical protein WAW86_10110 [Gammaproteobacteria bacterium]